MYFMPGRTGNGNGTGNEGSTKEDNSNVNNVNNTTSNTTSNNSRWFSKLKTMSLKISTDPNINASKDDTIDHLVFLVHGIGEHEEKWKNIVPK